MEANNNTYQIIDSSSIHAKTNKTKYYNIKETKEIFTDIKKNDLSIFHFNTRSLKKKRQN